PPDPLASRSGLHRRSMMLIDGLLEMGAKITIVSSTATSGQLWSPSTLDTLRNQGVAGVFVHRKSTTDRIVTGSLRRLFGWTGISPPLISPIETPPGLRRYFRNVAAEVNPDVVLMMYAFMDPLVDHDAWRSTIRALDTQDLVSVNRKMWRMIM